MTIIGIGTDIIEISRIKKAIHRYKGRFLERVFTPNERTYCERFSHPESHYAGRFAAKEAIFKALGTGIGNGIGWHDADIVAHVSGRPEVILSHHLLTHFPYAHILLSISHSQDYATATALLIDTYGT